MPHSTPITIRWGDTDAGGLIYYPRFFHFTIVGVNQYFAPAVDGEHPMERFRTEDAVLPAVEASASFHSPLRAGDRVTIETTVTDVGTSSFTASFRIAPNGERDSVADIEVSFVFVDRDFRAQPLPPEILACIEHRGDDHER